MISWINQFLANSAPPIAVARALPWPAHGLSYSVSIAHRWISCKLYFSVDFCLKLPQLVQKRRCLGAVIMYYRSPLNGQCGALCIRIASYIDAVCEQRQAVYYLSRVASCFSETGAASLRRPYTSNSSYAKKIRTQHNPTHGWMDPAHHGQLLAVYLGLRHKMSVQCTEVNIASALTFMNTVNELFPVAKTVGVRLYIRVYIMDGGPV